MSWYTREILKNAAEIKRIMLKNQEEDRAKDEAWLSEYKKAIQKQLKAVNKKLGK